MSSNNDPFADNDDFDFDMDLEDDTAPPKNEYTDIADLDRRRRSQTRGTGIFRIIWVQTRTT